MGVQNLIMTSLEFLLILGGKKEEGQDKNVRWLRYLLKKKHAAKLQPQQVLPLNQFFTLDTQVTIH
jgi:hypothetical protein